MKLEVRKDCTQSVAIPGIIKFEKVRCPISDSDVEVITCFFNRCGKYGGYDRDRLICLWDETIEESSDIKDKE
jgi:hypothetical protein